MKWIFASLISLATSVCAQQAVQTVRGKVLDSESGLPLWGAKVVLVQDSLFIGAITDSSGIFSIHNVPVGRQSFRITCLGYEEQMLNEIPVTSGKELVLEISLQESFHQLGAVQVTSRGEPINSMTTVSARVFSIDETSRYAGSFNDPAKMAQAFAGVSSSGDVSNGLVIRGNSSKGVLWRLEGVEIGNPNHFREGEGASGGGISILSSNVLANSDFLTGAFPAEYGNASSGVFDIHLRKGNALKREYAVELGILGTEISLEGPFSKRMKSSYLVNYRYSTLDLLFLSGINLVGDVIPRYQDLTFNLSFPSARTGDFTVFGIGGISNATLEAERDSLNWLSLSDREEEVNHQVMSACGVTHQIRLPGQKAYIKTVLTGGFMRDVYEQGFLDSSYTLKMTEINRFDYPFIRATSMINWKFKAGHTFRAGAIYSHLMYALQYEFRDGLTNEMVSWINSSGSTGLVQAFAQWRKRWANGLSVNYGLHSTLFLLNNRTSLEPRAGLKYDWNKLNSFRFGLGLHSRLEPVSLYLAEAQLSTGETIRPNESLKLMKAAHGVVGYSRILNENWRLTTELYVQYLYDVPVSVKYGTVSTLNSSSGFGNDSLINVGTGTNYGAELTLERSFNKGWFLLLTGSLFDSKYIGADGIERNTRFNSNYLANMVCGKEFRLGQRGLIALNSRLTWRGGNRVVPIDLTASVLAGETIYDSDRSYAEQLPDYLRWDLSLNYKVDFSGWSFSAGVDAQNVTNRQNIRYQYYDSESQSVKSVNQFGAIPIVRVKFWF